MRKVSAVGKSTAAFGGLGAWLGGISSFVFEYWGSHNGTWLAVLDARTRPMAWDAVISNVQIQYDWEVRRKPILSSRSSLAATLWIASMFTLAASKNQFASLRPLVEH
jgi:hypothetical protein